MRPLASLHGRLTAALRQRRPHQRRQALPAQRPALSPLLATLGCAWVAVGATVGAQIARGFGQSWLGVDPLLVVAIALAITLAAGALMAACVPRARVIAALGLVGLVSGALAGGTFAWSTAQATAALEATPTSAHLLVVEGDPRRSSTGALTFEAQVVSAGAARGTRVWVSLPASLAHDAPAMGEVVRIVGRWKPFADDDWGRSMLARGCGSAIAAKRCEVVGTQGGPVGAIRRLRSRLLATVDPTSSQARALVAGVVLGDQADLAAYQVADDFANLGLSHLVAVSGSHLAVIAGLLGAVLGALRLRPVPRLGVSAFVLLGYVVLSGLQSSAIRSVVMALAAQGAGVVGRRRHALSALGAAALAMLLINPANAARMGFQLSVLSVLGIACLSGLLACWIDGVCHPFCLPDAVRSALALTLVSQLVTLPITLPAFGVLPVLSPLANVVVAPVVSATLLLGVVSAPLATLAGSAAPVLLAPCTALAQLACALAHLLARVPYAAIPLDVSPVPCALVSITLLALAYVRWPQPRPRTLRLAALCPLLACCMLFACWRLLAPARVVVLDVGQGDAILVQQGPSALLVDTGPGEAVLSALARAHVIHLDAVLLTHTDADHAGGLASLAGLVGVDRVIVAQGVAQHIYEGDPALEQAIDRAARGRLEEVTAGDVLHVGAFTLAIVSPRGPVVGNENPDSIVAVARLSPQTSPGTDGRDLSVLLTGDAERDLTGPLAQAGAFGDVDVLKVGHHGSAISVSPELLAGCTPELAVVSAGEHNRYGHPTQQCRDELAKAGVPLLCTIDAGDIELRPGRDGVRVRCRNRQACQAALASSGVP